MNKYALDQKAVSDTLPVVNTATKLQRKSQTSIPNGSILEGLIEFAYSVTDFRRTDRGNHHHELGDILMLMILSRMSGCVGRADMIEFGRYNLKKFQSMGMLRNGVSSEPTLCRVRMDRLNGASRTDGSILQNVP